MSTRFPGYPAKGITWLRQIVEHNERSWFQAHKAAFETHVKGPTEALVEVLNRRLEKFAPDYVADPRKALSRIYRDVRFSKDKSPYNTFLGVRFGHHGRKREACAGFWVSISAKGFDIVGGSYSPGAPQLAKIRARLAADHRALEALCRRKPLRNAMGELRGEKLKRVPRGWAADHPAAELLKHKQLFFHAQLPLRVAQSPDLVNEVIRRFRLMTPFVTFLDEALG